MRAARILLAVSTLAALGCTPPAAAESSYSPSIRSRPFVRVVGTAQDGGLPHAACSCARCETARFRPDRRRRVSGLAIVLPQQRRVYLIDATPDIRAQIHSLRDVRDQPTGQVDRKPVDGLLLTHAHIGHYLGLAFLGYEAVHTRGLPVFCTQKMAGFLRVNGPWEQLVRLGNVDLQEVSQGEAFTLEGDVRITAILVPHRQEYSDTVGYLIEGKERRLLYIPDTEPWRTWKRPPRELIEAADIALLDGTFYSTAELPGRDVESIGHPLIIDTMDLLQESVRTGKVRVFFTHLNHSNPALDPASLETEAILRRGFAVLEEGKEFPL